MTLANVGLTFDSGGSAIKPPKKGVFFLPLHPLMCLDDFDLYVAGRKSPASGNTPWESQWHGKGNCLLVSFPLFVADVFLNIQLVLMNLLVPSLSGTLCGVHCGQKLPLQHCSSWRVCPPLAGRLSLAQLLLEPVPALVLVCLSCCMLSLF